MKKIISLALLLIASMSAISSIAQKKAIIHFKSGSQLEYLCSEIDSITFEDAEAYDLNISAKYSRNFYLGNGQYFVYLSDRPLNDNGLPTENGQVMTRFLAIAPAPTTDTDITLPQGEYPSSDSGKAYTIYLTQWDFYLDCIMVCQGFDEGGNPTGYIRDYSNCKAQVSQNGDKTYINFTGELIKEAENEPYSNVHCTYNGPKLIFENEDVAKYEKLEADATITPTLFNGAYYGYGAYNLIYTNAPVDTTGYITGAGQFLNVELLTNATETMDVNQLPGTYSICQIDGTTFTPGSFVSGIYTKDENSGSYMPMGTYYTTFDEKGYSTKIYGLATGGTITLSIEGTNLRFNGDIITESGAHVKMNALAPLAYFIDLTQAQSQAPTATVSKENAMPTTVGSVRLNSFRKATKFGTSRPTMILKKISK